MILMNSIWNVYFALPPIVRQKLRSWLKGTPGHGSSRFNRMIAMRDAHGKCRIDRCAQSFCEYLSASNITDIDGRQCLEIGTGYVGSSAVVMWLLGARNVTSVDLNHLFVPAALKESLLSVEKTELFNIMKKHARSEESLSNRINQVYTWADAMQGSPSDFFIYLAPFDLLACELNGPVDFIYSISTFEHIPKSIVSQFVERMASFLGSDGEGMHCIDLTDHFDSKANPFGFLALAGDDYSDDSYADSRGNRIRGSEWLGIFRKSGMTAEIVMSSRAPRSHLPENLASPFHAMSEEELLVTSVVIHLVKQPVIT